MARAAPRGGMGRLPVPLPRARQKMRAAAPPRQLPLQSGAGAVLFAQQKRNIEGTRIQRGGLRGAASINCVACSSAPISISLSSRAPSSRPVLRLGQLRRCEFGHQQTQQQPLRGGHHVGRQRRDRRLPARSGLRPPEIARHADPRRRNRPVLSSVSTVARARDPDRPPDIGRARERRRRLRRADGPRPVGSAPVPASRWPRAVRFAALRRYRAGTSPAPSPPCANHWPPALSGCETGTRCGDMSPI